MTSAAGALATLAAWAAWLNRLLAGLDPAPVQALGGALLHFLWEAAAVALLVAVVNAALARASAGLRYWVATLGLLSLPVLFVATFMTLLLRPTGGLAMAAVLVVLGRAVTARLPLLVGAWMLGVGGFALYSAGGWLAMARLRRTSSRLVPAEWKELLSELRRRMNCRAAVELGLSAQVSSPCAMGWLRPLILMPLSFVSGIPVEHLRALLAHELSHIRRHDYLVNLAQRGVEVLFFFHPAVWWLSGRVSQERENCCDDAGVAVCGNRVAYARALVELAALEAAKGPWAPLVAANGGEIRGRVQRVLRLQPVAPRSQRRSWARAIARATVATGAGLALAAAAGLALIAGPARPSAPAPVNTSVAVARKLAIARGAVYEPVVYRRPIEGQPGHVAPVQMRRATPARPRVSPAAPAAPAPVRRAATPALRNVSLRQISAPRSEPLPAPAYLMYMRVGFGASEAIFIVPAPTDGVEPPPPAYEIRFIEFGSFVLRPGQFPAEVIMISS